MKIEKISENQIRCTLYRADLLDREIRISELAYGSEKAKELFREMMQQASFEVGFEAEDIPLMIEAIPISSECLMLIITKVDDPEELDTRFAKFTQSEDMPFYNSENDSDDDDDEDEDDNDSDPTNDIINLFNNINANNLDEEEVIRSKSTVDKNKSDKTYSVKSNLVIKVYSFNSLDEITKLAKVLSEIYFGSNTLYKDNKMSRFYLLLNKSNHTSEDFSLISDIASEYGKKEKVTYASKAYFDEHFEVIIKENAIKILSNI